MKIIKKLLCVAAIASTFVSTAQAQNDKDVALMLKTKGKVEVNQQGRNIWSQANRGERIHSGQVVRTGDEALAALVFTDDKTQLKIRSNSSVTINGKREKEGVVKRISLGFGELWAKVTRQNTAMRVETPSGVATVKGTEFNALYLNAIFYVYCQEGLIEIFNQFGTMLLGPNEMARLLQGQPPQRIEGNPNDLFELSGDDSQGSVIEIEFENSEGSQKKLIIEY
jgi:ferric-dicitrate binding protein FerR (iron transport regulator)